MKIEVAKPDLETATRVLSIKEDQEELSSHLVFRHQGGDHVEILASNSRVGVSTRISGCTVSDVDDDTKTFTVEGAKFKKWINAFGTAMFTLTYTNGVAKGVASGPVRGSATFRTTDPSNFSFWDKTLEESDEVATIKASRLHAALSHVRLYMSNNDTTAPKLAVTEIRDGKLQSTDKSSLGIVTIPGLEKSNLRIHGKDIPHVLSFLNTCGDDDITIREHARSLFLVRGYEVLLVGRPNHEFVTLKVEEGDAPHKWGINKQHLREAVKSVSANAVGNDKRVNFRLDGGVVILSMAGVADADRTSASIEISEMYQREDSPPIPETGFDISYEYLEKILSQYQEDLIQFELFLHKSKGWSRIQENRDGDNFRVILAWL